MNGYLIDSETLLIRWLNMRQRASAKPQQAICFRFINPLAKYETNSLLRLCRINLRSESFVIKNEFLA